MLRYLFHVPPNVKVWHKAFFSGSGRRAVAHTRPAFPKNAYGPVGIPLIRGTSGAGRSTQPPEADNSLGGRPPEAEGNYPAAETHPARSAPQPARPVEVRPDNWISKMLRYLFHAPPNVKVWHKAFFWWVRAQGRSPLAPGISQKCLRPRRHFLIRSTSGAGWSTQPPEGGNSLGGRPPEAVGKIQLPRRTRPDPRRSQHGRPKCDPTTESAKCCGIPLQTQSLLCSSNLATSRRLISFSSLKQVTPLASFSSSGFHVPVAERAYLLFLWGKIVRGITTTKTADVWPFIPSTSRKPSKACEQNILRIAWDLSRNSKATFTSEPLHMDSPLLADQHRLILISSVWTLVAI